MMKRLLTFLSLMIIPTFCFGDASEYVTATIKENTTFNYALDLKNILNQQLDIIEERIKQINPGLVKSTENNTNEQKIVKYNNYLVEKTFNDYKNFFFEDLKEKSIKTGRVIMSEEYNNDTYHWLNRGELDTDKCKPQYHAKKSTKSEREKEIKDLQEHTCFYPYGFEDYSINWQGDGGIETLNVTRDFLTNKERIVIKISMMARDNADNLNDIMAHWIFHVSYNVYDYDDVYAYLNQHAQDVKDGMYKVIMPKTKKELKDCQKSKTPFGCVFIGNDDMRKWKSANMVPGAHYTDLIIDRSFGYRK